MVMMMMMMGLFALVVVPLVSAEVCYQGTEPDPDKGNKLRWVLPVPDPCRCTVIRLGGVNLVTPQRSFQPHYGDELFATKDATKIRKQFNCTDVPAPTATRQPADCQAVRDSGQTVSGLYTIQPQQFPGGLQVYCEMTADQGWIVFQRRVDGSVNFTRSWAEYRDGFGDKEGEFWLGNEILRRLTEPVDGEQGWQMRVELFANQQQDGMYDDFHVDGNNYTLHVGAFTSPTRNLGDQLSVQYPSNGQPFSTYDRDNDADTSQNCAEEMKGGWWFNQCTVMDDFDGAARHSNLNGEYSQTPAWKVYGNGIVWTNVQGQITRSEMKMRRKI